MIPVPSDKQLNSPNTPPHYALWGRHHWDEQHAKNLLLHFIHHKGLDSEFLDFLLRVELAYNIESELVEERRHEVKPGSCLVCGKSELEISFTKLCAYLCSHCINNGGSDGRGS